MYEVESLIRNIDLYKIADKALDKRQHKSFDENRDLHNQRDEAEKEIKYAIKEIIKGSL